MQHSSEWIFFWMSNDFFQRLTKLKGTYFHQMSCTRDDFSAKISLKEHFWRDLIGVWKITLLSKDPVYKYANFCFYGVKIRENLKYSIVPHCSMVPWLRGTTIPWYHGRMVPLYYRKVLIVPSLCTSLVGQLCFLSVKRKGSVVSWYHKCDDIPYISWQLVADILLGFGCDQRSGLQTVLNSYSKFILAVTID